MGCLGQVYFCQFVNCKVIVLAFNYSNVLKANGKLTTLSKGELVWNDLFISLFLYFAINLLVLLIVDGLDAVNISYFKISLRYEHGKKLYNRQN